MQKTINRFDFNGGQGPNSGKSLIPGQIYSNILSKLDRRALKFSQPRKTSLRLKLNIGQFLPQAPQLIPIHILPRKNPTKLAIYETPP